VLKESPQNCSIRMLASLAIRTHARLYETFKDAKKVTND
jgi:hypothetical protein